LGANGPICVHFTTRNRSDPLQRNWSDLIQEAPRSASWNALRALSNIKKAIPKKKLFPSLIKNIFVRPILKCHTYVVLYSIHPPQLTMTVI